MYEKERAWLRVLDVCRCIVFIFVVWKRVLAGRVLTRNEYDNELVRF